MTSDDYVPARNWERKNPADLGFDGPQLEEALEFAAGHEIDVPRELEKILPRGERHPNDQPLGPLKPRGSPAGIVVRGGYIAAEYGDVGSVEVTFSATKSYISAVAGLAYDRGLITDLDEPVRKKVEDGGFDSEQNARITWRQLLQQTSEWEGELFGLPDWLDRGRQVAAAGSMGTIGASASGQKGVRELRTPGTFWEYNDVRVNRTALALLRLFERSLSDVLSEGIMRPIGVSDSWVWHGYDTSWVNIRGRLIQSVSGGAHWGGGLWIDTLDHARFGLLYLREGKWGREQVLSRQWIQESLKPCPIRPDYGFLWWLNHDGSIADEAGAGAFAARGAGGNIVFVEPDLDLVVVLRWCADTKRVLDLILVAAKSG